MPLDPDSTADAQALLNASCSPCHTVGNQRPNVRDIASLIGMPSGQSRLSFIEAGSRLDSYLWHKMNGSQSTQDAGPGRGSVMPRRGRLADDVVIRFGLWIDTLPRAD